MGQLAHAVPVDPQHAIAQVQVVPSVRQNLQRHILHEKSVNGRCKSVFMRQDGETALHDRITHEVMPRGLTRERFLPIHAIITPHLALNDTHGLSIGPNAHSIRHRGFLQVLRRLGVCHGLPKHA